MSTFFIMTLWNYEWVRNMKNAIQRNDLIESCTSHRLATLHIELFSIYKPKLKQTLTPFTLTWLVGVCSMNDKNMISIIIHFSHGLCWVICYIVNFSTLWTGKLFILTWIEQTQLQEVRNVETRRAFHVLNLPTHELDGEFSFPYIHSTFTSSNHSALSHKNLKFHHQCLPFSICHLISRMFGTRVEVITFYHNFILVRVWCDRHFRSVGNGHGKSNLRNLSNADLLVWFACKNEFENFEYKNFNCIDGSRIASEYKLTRQKKYWSQYVKKVCLFNCRTVNIEPPPMHNMIVSSSFDVFRFHDVNHNFVWVRLYFIWQRKIKHIWIIFIPL